MKRLLRPPLRQVYFQIDLEFKTNGLTGSFGVMLDLVETIGRLLVHSERNQAEFRNIDGYAFFINLFDTSEDEFNTKGNIEHSFILV